MSKQHWARCSIIQNLAEMTCMAILNYSTLLALYIMSSHFTLSKVKSVKNFTKIYSLLMLWMKIKAQLWVRWLHIFYWINGLWLWFHVQKNVCLDMYYHPSMFVYIVLSNPVYNMVSCMINTCLWAWILFFHTLMKFYIFNYFSVLTSLFLLISLWYLFLG